MVGAGLTAVAVILVAASWQGLPAAATPAQARTDTRHEVTHCTLPAESSSAPHAGMVWVPPGSLDMGDSVYPEEQPRTRTRVGGFWMDRTEVTNDAFAAFVAATHYVTVAERVVDVATHPGLPEDMRKPGAVVFIMPTSVGNSGDISQWWRYIPGANWRHPGGPDTSIAARGAFPVVAVTYEDAQAYASWRGTILPSEAQWEWAARGSRQQPIPDHEQPNQANTWQGMFPVVNSGDDGFVGLAPVGCYAPNRLGIFDMIGNVWELTRDIYSPNHRSVVKVDAESSTQSQNSPPDQVPSGIRGMPLTQRVIKGGSYLCAPNYCMRYRAGARQPQEADLAASHLGFRTVLIAPPPPSS